VDTEWRNGYYAFAVRRSPLAARQAASIVLVPVVVLLLAVPSSSFSASLRALRFGGSVNRINNRAKTKSSEISGITRVENVNGVADQGDRQDSVECPLGFESARFSDAVPTGATSQARNSNADSQLPRDKNLPFPRRRTHWRASETPPGFEVHGRTQ